MPHLVVHVKPAVAQGARYIGGIYDRSCSAGPVGQAGWTPPIVEGGGKATGGIGPTAALAATLGRTRS